MGEEEEEGEEAAEEEEVGEAVDEEEEEEEVEEEEVGKAVKEKEDDVEEEEAEEKEEKEESDEKDEGEKQNGMCFRFQVLWIIINGGGFRLGLYPPSPRLPECHVLHTDQYTSGIQDTGRVGGIQR